jgi:hypothetical protein
VPAFARRLPGIDVGVTPPLAAEALPRMDVAVFVGFASTGPVHTPVAIESIARFTDVFGADAPLAWDDVRGERVVAYLGPAVRAFFSNGGRRCWIIRVARNPIANEFAIPGVLSVGADGAITSATAVARCEGSWSDSLRVASALLKWTFAVNRLASTSPASGGFDFRTRFGLRSGDVIEVGNVGVTAYAIIDDVRATPEANGPYAVHASVSAAFEPLIGNASPSSPPVSAIGTAEVQGFGPPVPATLFTPAEADLPARLAFDAPVPSSLERGHWVRWSDGGDPVWLRIDEISGAAVFAGSPPAMDSAAVSATVTGPAWRELGGGLALPFDGVTRAHLVSLDLQVDEEGERVARLNGIGLTPAHAEAWWNQQGDADVFRADETVGGASATVSARVQRARFPLARAPIPVPRAWAPLGVTTLFGPSLAPFSQPLTALERDGLAQFDADLFLDAQLAGAPLNAVAELADAIRFLGNEPRPLRGLHAAWSIGVGGLFNEVSLLAIPDAIHVGWHPRSVPDVPEPEPRSPPSPPRWSTHRGVCAAPVATSIEGPDFGVFLDCSTHALIAPELSGPAAPVPPGAYRLTWTDSEPQGSYVLVESTQADFADSRQIFAGPDIAYVAFNPREGIYYYQVFAQVGDERSSGSNAITVTVRSDEWVQNRPTRDIDEQLEPHWLAVHRAALRMAAAGGDLFVAAAMPRHFRTEQAIRYAQRLREVREPTEPIDPGALGFTEARALSYGALYFPWLQSDVRAANQSRDLANAVRQGSPGVLPPDGVAIGVLAARAANRGAWIAPANEPLQDVVALTPVVPAVGWQALQDAQINLLRPDPRGFLALSADTLARELELRPINVRRLLTLLRRLALRRGITYVFEPNGSALRRAVQRGFEVVLTDLFQRGAFAGATAEQSFRVVTDGTVNTQRDADAGRFIVELRVAPSVPMRFISVRLAQSGARLAVNEEF